jgi:pimeloyl-ACP methyl ester carboxylesterase
MQGASVGLLEQLPSRFVGGPAHLPVTRFRLRVGRAVRDVVATNQSCRVEKADGTPDVEISADLATWKLIDAGELSGIEAFALGKLVVRGSIEKSLLFEPLFSRPAAGGLEYKLERVSLGGIEMSTLIAGDENASPLVLIHGLGATKASWLPVVPQLARHHRVYALDLPGFGSSSKPRGRYNAPWFADHVFRFLDMVGEERAFVAGNSLGGRVAIEMAMQEPERVLGIACLCPAAAFVHRPALRLVRMLRPEFGFAAVRLPREQLKENLKQLFYESSRINDDWYDAAIDDFLHNWKSIRSRLAFFAALRNVYLDEPDGEEGFWTRLSDIRSPAFFIYGRHDVLITPRFAGRIEKFLPSARVLVWEDCGHVPQLEHPERTVEELTGFYASVSSAAIAG